MTTKIKGTEGVEFPDSTVQATAADAGPAFSAKGDGTQTVPSAVMTKALFSVEDFDTAGFFASSRFAPQIPGYYQINFAIGTDNAPVRLLSELRKNGNPYSRGSDNSGSSSPIAFVTTGSALVQMNGTTDYLEVFTYCDAIPVTLVGYQTRFSGFLARRAAP